jgi:hypothetical protein
MTLKIVRNEAANCITFGGASVPVYFNGCLSGEVNSTDSDKVNVRNDIRSLGQEETYYEFFGIHYTEFLDKDGQVFNSSQEVADYLTEQSNVLGVNSVGKDLTGVAVNFRLDQTSTSIIMDNGYSFGVNTIKAIGEGGLIKIKSIGEGIPTGTEDPVGRVHFESIDHTLIQVNGSLISGGLNDVINTLNELFTVGAFEAIVIADPYATMVADVDGVDATVGYIGYSIDPIGNDVYGTTNLNSQNGLKTVETINQAGEYYTFDIRVEGTIGFGLVHSQTSYDNGKWVGDTNYADPASFGVYDSPHSGFQFSHWFHSEPDGSWVNYGADTSHAVRPGWTNFNNTDEQVDWLDGNPIKVKVGIDTDGYISISTLRDGVSWVVHTRTSYPVVAGSEFHLGIKTNHTEARVFSLPKLHLLAVDDSPTTMGDTNITLLGDATGTLADGIATLSGSNSNNGFITKEGLSASGEYFEFEVNLGHNHTISLVNEDTNPLATIAADTTLDLVNKYSYFGQPINELGSVTSSHNNWSGLGVISGDRFVATHFRIGFDNQGKLTVWSSSDGVNFIVSKQLNAAAVNGDYRLMYIGRNPLSTFESLAKGVLTVAPVMYFRYIESPDANFHYPLFSTEEEANYYDLKNGGTGTNSANVYPDEPTFTTWYSPTNGHTTDGTSVPTDAILFEGNPVSWTEITSVDNAALTPDAFVDTTITVAELSAVNLQLHTEGASYITSIIDTDSSGLTIGPNGIHLNGTSPAVLQDYDVNPSDTYTIEVVRTNSYGSSSGILTLVVTNLTAPTVAISGFTHVSGTAVMVDSDTLGDGSVVKVDTTVNNGERFVIEKAYIEANVLPNLNAVNTKYIVGLSNPPEDFGTLELTDFDAAIVWEYETASAHSFKFYRDGTMVQSMIINSMTQAFYDYAIEVRGTSAWLVASNLNTITTEPSPANGGSFSNTYEVTSIEDTVPVTIYMATLNTSGDLSTDGIMTITTPTVSKLTGWTKALDFSGSSEHLKQASQSASSNALRMAGVGALVSANPDNSKTSTHTSSRPWATAVVFKHDGNNSNQHIWNSGEGVVTDNDNIYLRLSSSHDLIFGWGREGVEENECVIASIGSSVNVNQWWGIYIAHKGARLSGANATESNLNDAFDIKLMSTGGIAPAMTTIQTVTPVWSSTGASMDRAVSGDFTVGGLGPNRNFHGKVASMLITTLKMGQTLPNDSEVKMMITDPKQWVEDYKVGQYSRVGFGTTTFLWEIAPGQYSTQIWLMGDGTADSFVTGVRNEINPSDGTTNKLQLVNMVSNDFENVSIAGLS